MTTFSGNIVNSGTISAHVRGIGVGFAPSANKVAIPSFVGSIVNQGRISAGTTGIAVLADTFTGGITNAGTITAGGRGLGLGFVPTFTPIGVSHFSGSIVNSGTITAKRGIGLIDSTIAGAIVDTGTIAATSHGLLIDSAGILLGGIEVGSHGVIDVSGGDAVAVRDTTRHRQRRHYLDKE